ncbi:MRC1-like domain-containing protein [Aspergillus terricola var. indicus]
MSSPSTPRTARSASAAAASPEMLTPGRKIKAMLAAFDSDSDSEPGSPVELKTHKNAAGLPRGNTKSTTRPSPTDSDDEDDDDEDIIMPRGRMAARLLSKTTENKQIPTESAFERVSKTLRAKKDDSDDMRRETADDATVSSDDDLPTDGLRRRVQQMRGGDESFRSPSRARSFSPMFISSPAKSLNDGQEHSEASDDAEEDVAPKHNSRFLQLVAQKRKEREEKERAEAEKKAARVKEREALNANMFSDGESIDDDTPNRKKTTQARPARRAGKKALEEMSRETQRMSRNMQLAHEARTKKKISKESFFARFNFMQSQAQTAPQQPGDNSSSTGGSQQSSDVEAHKDKGTPQTSPVLPPADAQDEPDKGPQNYIEFPAVTEPLGATVMTEEISGKEEDQPSKSSAELSSVKNGMQPLGVAPVRVRLSREQVARHQMDDSDSDLEIVTSPAKCRRIAAFENLPARKMQEPSSMFKLKALAQLTSPSRKSTMMNPAELSASLLYQAKLQAAKERMERIEELRAKGIVIETAAERAAFEDEVENLVEKARQEGEAIAKQERAAAKKANGGDEDDEDDIDFELSGSEDEDVGDADPEGEGHESDEGDEEEEDEEDEDTEDKAEANKEANIIDSEACEDDNSDDNDESEDDTTAEPALQAMEMPTQRRKRVTRVVSDDEDEEVDQPPKTPAKPINPFLNSVERPNIPVKPSEATMSLTQAFAGTLATSQDLSQLGDTIPNSLPDPVPMSIDGAPDSQIVIKDSQEQRAGSADPFTGHWRPGSRAPESPASQSVSQMSQIPDPTQDAGFVLSPFDPSKRFLGTPTSTIETVLVEQNHSPAAARKMRNLKRGKAPQLSAIEKQEEGDFEIDASAFNVMKTASKRAKRQAELFDRKKSKAKDVVEEAAEESDDEYAGLGGASDDETDDEENAYDREMINDNSGEKVDAKQLAALNALHQRNADEKDVAKLLKDITTGALRRRRNNDDEFDLDDSDDELLARRRQKQREFARMRNALLADGKVGELAENPKKAAFFKAIEDRDDDDDAGLDFLGYEQESATQDESQGGAAQTPEGESNSSKRKRPLEPAADDVNNRPPPHLRRKPASAMSKKPATLAEIREAVSFLTERPEYDSFHEDASIDDEEGEQQANADNEDTGEHESDEPTVTSRQRDLSPAVGFTHPRRTRGPVVDRLALLRQASSNSASTPNNSRLAFHTGAASEKAASFGFKPPILRKTTTASSSSSSSSTSDASRGVTKAPGPAIAKKGSVNYYTAAREREREKQLRTQHRNRGSNIEALLSKHAGNRAGMGALGHEGQWE